MAIDFSTRFVRFEQPASAPLAAAAATQKEKCRRENCNCGLEHAGQVATPSDPRCKDCGTPLSAENKSTKSGGLCDECCLKLMDTLRGVIHTKQGEKRPKAVDDPLAFPEECLADDKLGDLARDMKLPLGVAYPAILACASAKPNLERMCGARINLYCALIVKPGGCKNEAIRRALIMSGLVNGLDYIKSAPGGDAQLIGLLGDRPNRKKADSPEDRIPGPRKMLLVTNEIGDVLSKTGIDNSTLASRLCDFWDDSEYTKLVGKDQVHVDCRLSWLGGLPASLDKPDKFSEFFGGETNFGLYPRFIYGYSGAKFNFRDWEPPSRSQIAGNAMLTTEDDAADYLASFNNNDATVVHGISPEAKKLWEEWEPGGNPDDEGRIKYNGKKIAILKACFNGEREVSEKRMGQAIIFMHWQVKIRERFKPGVAKETNREAWFTEHLIPALERAGAYEQFVSWRRISLRNRWDEKIDAGVQIRTVENLVKLGRLIEEPEDEDDSKKRGRRARKFPHVMLRKVAEGES
jgi:transposase-like protein